jgi:hypothetical protein
MVKDVLSQAVAPCPFIRDVESPVTEVGKVRKQI